MPDIKTTPELREREGDIKNTGKSWSGEGKKGTNPIIYKKKKGGEKEEDGVNREHCRQDRYGSHLKKRTDCH